MTSGAFLIPYLCMLVIEGVPLLILELHIGQRFRRGPLLAFRDMSKYAVGIGMACMMSSFLTACYYNTVIAWCVYYMGMSFRSELAWEKCPGSSAENNTSDECDQSGAASYFWYRETLNIADSIDEPGGISWKILLSTIAAWTLICVCLIKGIKSSGKVGSTFSETIYTCSTSFIQGGVLHGNISLYRANDISHPRNNSGRRWRRLEASFQTRRELTHKHILIRTRIQNLPFQFSKIFDGTVWREAASQIFFTLSLAGGGLISMSSYNSYNNNFAKDALIVAAANSATSLYAGCVIFSIVG